jgi:succinyl-diaminopimelate desuccinylase
MPDFSGCPIALTQTLIRCPSVTPQNHGVLEVMEQCLRPLGFVIHRQIFAEAGEAPVENLYARFGTAEPNLCFAGHLDVVPVGDAAAWQSDPFAAEIRDGFLYGRGAEDMKGAIACFMVAAARVIKKQGNSLRGSLSFLITLDEEGPSVNGTKKMLQWLAERGETLSYCLVGEPTNPERLGEMIKIGRRGSMNATITVQGKQGHVAYPDLADNPVSRLIRILYRLKEQPLDAGTEYFQPSNLEVVSVDVGNPTSNVIPAAARALLNIRFNDSRPAAALKEWLETICHEEAGTATVTLETRVSGDAFVTKPNHLTQILQDVAEEITGIRPVLSTTGGTSDARFIKDFCPVMEFGTTGRTSHMVNENVATTTLEQLTDIYEQMLLRVML